MRQNSTTEIIQELHQLMVRFSRLKWSQQICSDLTPSECEVLGYLYLATTGETPTKISASVLSNELKITPAAVTHLVNALEAGGYLQRQKDLSDRRVVLIELTKKGTLAAKTLIQDALQNLEKLANHLGENDSRALVRIMSAALTFFSENPPSS